MRDSCSRVTVVGDGAMGTLCSLLQAERGAKVALWGVSPDHVATLQRDRENKRYLPGYPLPEAVSVSHHAAEAFADTQLIISAVPCQFMRSIWKTIAAHCPRDIPIVSVAKGLEVDTLLLPTAIIQDCVGKETPVGCLSGPSIASEVAAHKPASLVAAATQPGVAELTQKIFSNTYLRVYTSRDLLGVELAGAVKNVIAIAAGICDGIGAGDNAKASLLTRGLVEIARLGEALGASADTFRGLAGVGDLFTTCVSRVGRNRTAGEKIGAGLSAAEVVESTRSVIEGIPTTQSVLELAKRHHVELPIVSAVANVLFSGMAPRAAIESLMTRRLRAE